MRFYVFKITVVCKKEKPWSFTQQPEESVGLPFTHGDRVIISGVSSGEEVASPTFRLAQHTGRWLELACQATCPSVSIN